MGLLASLFFGFLPMFFYAAFIYWLDRYEKEPLLLLGGVFVWGALIASAGAFLINTILGVGILAVTGSERAADITTSTLIAPVIEEALKGFAVLMVFWLARKEFDSILDGIVYAGVAALGFAATENSYYIYTFGYAAHGWSGLAGLVFVRVILVGWQHPFYTAFSGIGLAIARLQRGRTVKVLAPLLGFGAAVFTHALHNLLANLLSGAGIFAGFALDWSGWLAMFIFILILIQREKRWMEEYLKEEVGLGTLTSGQYQTATSPLRRLAAHFEAIGRGHLRQTSRFYQVCAELSHKKRELLTLGDENGNGQIVVDLRNELARISAFAEAG